VTPSKRLDGSPIELSSLTERSCWAGGISMGHVG
jgi:hypothetical protein